MPYQGLDDEEKKRITSEILRGLFLADWYLAAHQTYLQLYPQDHLSPRAQQNIAAFGEACQLMQQARDMLVGEAESLIQESVWALLSSPAFFAYVGTLRKTREALAKDGVENPQMPLGLTIEPSLDHAQEMLANLGVQVDLGAKTCGKFSDDFADLSYFTRPGDGQYLN